MKKKVLLMTTVAVFLLAAVIAAALNAVFTVTRVEVTWSLFSSAGEEEAVELQEKLEKAYVGKSTTFLDLDDVKSTVSAYPCFEIVSCQKSFPQKVFMEIKERKEVFALQNANGAYSMLDENGLYLYDSAENVSRLGGGNILLENFSFVTGATGEAVQGEYLLGAIEMVKAFAAELENARANILSVTYLTQQIEGVYFRFQMQEGVYIDVYSPMNNTQKKAEAALEAYLALSDSEKTYGFFDLIDLKDNPDQFTVSRHSST